MDFINKMLELFTMEKENLEPKHWVLGIGSVTRAKDVDARGEQQRGRTGLILSAGQAVARPVGSSHPIPPPEVPLVLDLFEPPPAGRTSLWIHFSGYTITADDLPDVRKTVADSLQMEGAHLLIKYQDVAVAV
ncbi:uncharacterized protein LOC144092156 isoform X1 [Stigmatopora argus]